MVPVIVAGHEMSDNGKVDIRIPKFRNEKFARWFIPRRKSLYHTLHLDELGSRVWIKIDGKKDIKEICNSPDFMHEDDRNERIGRFITQLYEARCIALLQPQNQ